jgi:hypothetical protein
LFCNKDESVGSHELFKDITAVVLWEKHEIINKTKVASNMADIRIHDLNDPPPELYFGSHTVHSPWFVLKGNSTSRSYLTLLIQLLGIIGLASWIITT